MFSHPYVANAAHPETSRASDSLLLQTLCALTNITDYYKYYSTPVGVRSIVINPSVRLCVSVCERMSGTGGPIFKKFCVQIRCGRGSLLVQQRGATLCTSGFMDDVTFDRNGPYGVVRPAWAASVTCMTGVESDVYECLLLLLLLQLTAYFCCDMWSNGAEKCRLLSRVVGEHWSMHGRAKNTFVITVSYCSQKQMWYILYKLLSQTLDTNLNFILHLFYSILFVVVFIVLIQLLLLHEISRYL